MARCSFRSFHLEPSELVLRIDIPKNPPQTGMAPKRKVQKKEKKTKSKAEVAEQPPACVTPRARARAE